MGPIFALARASCRTATDNGSLPSDRSMVRKMIKEVRREDVRRGRYVVSICRMKTLCGGTLNILTGPGVDTWALFQLFSILG